MVNLLGPNKVVGSIIIGTLFVLAFLFIVNPPAQLATGIDIVLLLIAYIVYLSPVYKNYLIGVSTKNALPSTGYAIIFTFIFFFITLFIPGLSIGAPYLPADVSGSLKFFLIVFIAPIAETIFFQGAVFGYFKNILSKGKKLTTKQLWIAIFLQALTFASFHLGAYVVGFYMYPSFTAGLTAITANITSFFVAFTFALIAGWWVSRDGIKNLLFVMLFHLGLNLVSYSLSVAYFITVGLPILLPTIKATGFGALMVFRAKFKDMKPILHK